MTANPSPDSLPPRLTLPLVRLCLVLALVVMISSASFFGTGASLEDFVRGMPSMTSVARQMFPPDFSRFDAIVGAMMVTAQIAVAGTFTGLCLSCVFGVLGSRLHTPHPWLEVPTKFMLAAIRTVPELLWALLFVVSVGPGAFAGVLSICMDTLGFAGRFFAESLDDVDHGPMEVLRVHGASRFLVLTGVAVPSAFPGLLHTAIYSLERAVRASVVLGIVGAGGIGIELKVAMDLFEYRRASAMVICILVVVIAVESLGSWLRRSLQASRT